MLFSDLNFIFRALPVFLLIYYAVPYKMRQWVMLIASLFFYAVNAGLYTLILILVVIINHLLSLKVADGSKGIFVVSCVLNAGLLIAFKGMAAFASGAETAPGRLLFAGDGIMLILPLGISFYVFKLISYQADLYTGKINRASFPDLALYITMFPQVMSGPISRFSFEKENSNRLLLSNESKKSRIKHALERIENGLMYFIAGLFLKTVLADHLSIMWKDIGTIGYDSLSVPMAWLGVFVYSMNLYYDFWGYSLMAAGLGVMTGYSFIRNFKSPYAANSVSDFYRRWHITLNEWFRDYVYIPLGGSRRSAVRTAFNLTVVWALTGLWHGITPNFFIWSGILLLIIMWEKFVLSKNRILFEIFGHLHVWILIPLSWIVFALNKTEDLKFYFMRLVNLTPTGAVINTDDYRTLLSEGWIYLVLALICLMPGLRRSFNAKRYSPGWGVILFVLFWISIYSITGLSSNPFMYMSF